MYWFEFDFGYILECKIGATAIIFDDIPNIDPVQASIPSGYKGFSWTNGNYLNAPSFPTSGYPVLLASGTYVAWFNYPMTVQTLMSNSTITLNSCIMGAGWSNSIVLTIDGYYNSILKNTTTTALNTYTQVTMVFNWYGLNKIVMTASGSGWLDVGLDNLCVTF